MFSQVDHAFVADVSKYDWADYLVMSMNARRSLQYVAQPDPCMPNSATAKTARLQGYGAKGIGEIPGGATLELDVELLSVKTSPFGSRVKLVEG